jgi:hypothetical protein
MHHQRCIVLAVLTVVTATCTATCTSDVPADRAPLARRPSPAAGAGGAFMATPPPAVAPQPPAPPPPPPAPLPPATVDTDGDGFSPASGDCEERSALINPGAYDFPGNQQDEDCSGADAMPGEDVCDDMVAIDSADAKDAARAIGLCRFVTEASKQWGVISASYVQADGKGKPADPAQTGILPAFGTVQPRHGNTMFALSSGAARAPGQAGFTTGCDAYSLKESEPPDGYPKESPSCPDTQFGAIYDSAGLELKIRVPTNANSFAFDSNFFTSEYPVYICLSYNDFFVAMLDPKPADLPDGNIVFDQDGNPVSVNNSLLQVCEPGEHGGKMFACPQGPAQLATTGYGGDSECSTGGLDVPAFGGLFGPAMPPADQPGDSGAATGWLHTTAPAIGGSIITLRFAIWDSGDAVLDSLSLVDDFTWSVETPIIETKPVVPD